MAARASSAWRRDSALLLQGDDGGDGLAGVQVLAVLLDFGGDDVLGGGGLAAAVGEVRGGDLLEIVDVVDEAAFDLVHLRVDVAGDGDVDEEHGAVAAVGEELLAVGAGEDVAVGAGGGDDDVGAAGLGVELLEGDDFGGAGEGGGVVGDLHGDLLGDVAGDEGGLLVGAVGDQDGGRALLDEVTGGELGHLAGADEQDGLAV